MAATQECAPPPSGSGPSPPAWDAGSPTLRCGVLSRARLQERRPRTETSPPRFCPAGDPTKTRKTPAEDYSEVSIASRPIVRELHHTTLGSNLLHMFHSPIPSDGLPQPVLEINLGRVTHQLPRKPDVG